jgi:hypothetical protein
MSNGEEAQWLRCNHCASWYLDGGWFRPGQRCIDIAWADRKIMEQCDGGCR